MLCLKSPRQGFEHGSVRGSSRVTTVGSSGHEPDASASPEWEDHQCCSWWSFSSNHVSGCISYFHTLSPSPLNVAEKRLPVCDSDLYLVRDVQVVIGGSSFSNAHKYYTAGSSRAALTSAR